MSSRSHELASDTLAGVGGNALRLWNRTQGWGAASVTHHAPVQCVAWNRNNKVVATGCQDGIIQLCYSGGKLMSVLRAEGGAAPIGSLTSLDWSTGSKFLAAGSANGSVYLWDLKVSKSYTTLSAQGGPVTSVRYHPEDKFLAIASSGAAGTVALYDLHGAMLGSLHAGGDTSAKYSLQATPAEAALACGSQAGGVLVWDWATRQVKEHYQAQHQGAVHAVSFIPLKPSMLFSAGADGKLILQDRRAGPSYASHIEVGAPLSALSVKEDYSNVAVGTHDGTVVLYDPRQLSAPLHRLDCSPGHPVASLHWQHCYSSLGSRVRSSSLKAKAQATADAAAKVAAPAPAAAAAAAAVAEAKASTSSAAAAAAAPASASTSAVGSRIPLAAAAAGPSAAANPTFSALRRHSGIGAGGPPAAVAAAKAVPREPSSHLTPSPVVQLNPLFDHDARAAQEGLAVLSQPADAAAAPAQQPSWSLQQLPPQAALTPVQQQQQPGYGTGLGLNITPLSGMGPPRAAAVPTPGHITPGPQPLQLEQPAAAASAASAPLPPSSAAEAAEAGTPGQLFRLESAEPVDFAITPLSTMAAARPASFADVLAEEEAAAQAASTLPPLQQQPAQLGAASGSFNITPLSTMRPPRGGADGAAAAAAGVLHDSTNQRTSAQLASLRQQQQQPGGGAAQLGAPSLAENLLSPQQGPQGSVGSRKVGPAAAQQQQPGGLKPEPVAAQQGSAAVMLVEDSAVLSFGSKLAQKQAEEAAAVAAAVTASEGGEEQWFVKAAPAQQQQHAASLDVAMPDAVACAGAPSPAFSFHAAATWQQPWQQEQQQQGSGGPGDGQQAWDTPDVRMGGQQGWAAPTPAAVARQQPAVAAAAYSGGAAGVPHGLREDILALHLDILNQFQVQQEQVHSLVQHVVQRQDSLAAEVNALRRQLQALMQTRNEFLWL